MAIPGASKLFDSQLKKLTRDGISISDGHPGHSYNSLPSLLQNSFSALKGWIWTHSLQITPALQSVAPVWE